MTKEIKTRCAEYQTVGKFGIGRVFSEGSPTSGSRQIEIIWKGKPPLFTNSHQVDLKSLKCDNLHQAVDKACHSLGYLPVFKLETIKGPKALVNLYYCGASKDKGYATIAKKHMHPLKFSLNRIELDSMGCSHPYEALKKAAFVTGQIKLKQIKG